MGRRILGLDPGLGTTGFGIIDREGSTVSLVACGVVRTPPGTPDGARLCLLSAELARLLGEHRPDAAAVEKLFFSKNVTTGIAVAQARGVILLELARAGLDVSEFTPNQVKQGVTGNGRAGKAQVREMVCRLLGIPVFRGPDDAADALAVALSWHPAPERNFS